MLGHDGLEMGLVGEELYLSNFLINHTLTIVSKGIRRETKEPRNIDIFFIFEIFTNIL